MALRDVELVEDEPERPVVPAGEPPARSWLRRHPAVAAAVAAVLVLVVGTAVVLDVRARRQLAARAEALRAVPGVLQEVDPALPVATSVSRSWDASGPLPAAVQAELYAAVAGDVGVVGSAAVGPGDDATEGVVTGVDVRTGEERWRTPVPPPPGVELEDTASLWCSGPDDDVMTGRLVAAAAGTPIGCTAQWFRVAEVGDEYTRTVVAAVELDPEDGSVRSRLDLGETAAVQRTADGWVVATRTDGVAVERLAADGTPRWRTELTPSPTESPWAWLTTRDARLLLTLGRDAWVLDLETGTVLAEHRDVGTASASLLPGGAVVLADPDDGVSATLYPPDGPPVPLGEEALVPLGVDDGSLGAVVLTSSGAGARDGLPVPHDDGVRTTLRRVDGSALWRTTDVDAHSALVVDGTLVLLGPTHLAVVDGDDGEVRWRVALPHRSGQERLLTDGAVLLVGAGRALDAWTFDGAAAWSAHVRDDGDGVELRAGAAAPTPTPTTGFRASSSDEFVGWLATRQGRLAAIVSSSSTQREHVLVVGRPGVG
ncbi:PQQ-binding-like beta-propeller repeat protein [Cellulomonas sp. NPDC057328]|uniref:outer membrane protein assembly factor BamB family protein n=1 Tax=Cellulomonas sp. NPDC057328 TaxID=3346101 RepID=UPI00363E6456